MQNPQSLTKPVVILALAVPLFAATWFVRQYTDTIVGPLAVATDGSVVAIAEPGKLHRLGADGSLRDTFDDAIALDARDAGVAIVGDDVLAGPAADGTLMSCDDEGCGPFSADPYAPTGPVQVGIADDRLWLSETEADRAHRFFTNGRRIDMPLSDLHQPGSVLQVGNTVYVCDSLNAVIDSYELHERGIGDATTFAKFSRGSGDEAINRPIRLVAHADGSFHAIFSNAQRTRGVLVQVAADGSTAAVDVDGLRNPVSLAALGNDLLVVDEDGMQVLQVGADGNARPFGEASFRAQLAARESMRTQLRILWPALLAAAVLAAVLGGGMLTRLLAAQRGDPARALKAGADGITWLPAEAELGTARGLRAALVASPLALAPAAAAWWLGEGLMAVGWVGAVVLVAALPAQIAAARAKVPNGLRMGLRDKLLIITDAERGMREYRLGQVAWSREQLEPEANVVVPLVRDGIALFHKPTLEASLFPLLPKDGKPQPAAPKPVPPRPVPPRPAAPKPE